MPICPFCQSRFDDTGTLADGCPVCGHPLFAEGATPNAPDNGADGDVSDSADSPSTIDLAADALRNANREPLTNHPGSDTGNPRLLPTAEYQALRSWDEAPEARHAETESWRKIENRAKQVIPIRRIRRATDSASVEANTADYEELEVLGKGYMGIVFAARQCGLGRTVAIKMLKAKWAGDRKERERFLSEAIILASLDHPNIVPAYDLGQDERSTPFFAMKLVKGTPWDKVLREKTLTENLNVLNGVADAVAFAHSRGIIHRNLKPDEVMLGDFGEAFLMDWGLAISSEMLRDVKIRESSGLAGTPAYMAPEMAVEGPLHRIDQTADVYLLGAVLYEILTGNPPHKGKDVLTCVLAAARNEIQPSEMSHPLLDVALRAMSTMPHDRYPNVGELQGAIRAWQDTTRPGQTEQERPPTSSTGGRVVTPLVTEQAFGPELVGSYYPFPIAIAYRRFCRTKDDDVAKLEALFSTLDATLRYLVTLATSDLLNSAARRGKAEVFGSHTAFDYLRKPKPMSLGAWLDTLRESARLLSRDDERVIKELPEVCHPREPLVEQVLATLVKERNPMAHPSGCIATTGEERGMKCLELRPLLEQLLERIGFVAHYPLGFAQRASEIPEIEPVELDEGMQGGGPYYLHSCMGAQIHMTNQAYYFAEKFAKFQEHTPFVVTPDGTRLLYLWPFLAQRRAPHSQRRVLYVFERIPNRRRRFLTEITTASTETRDDCWVQRLQDRPTSSHNWMLERIKRQNESTSVLPAHQVHEKLAPYRGGRLLGQSIKNNRLVRVIGRGGFGTIYLAETPDGRKIAVKVLESGEFDGRAIKRFRQEFEKLKKVTDHEGIIRCHDRGIATFEGNAVLQGQRFYWYSMDYALGGDLTEKLLERRRTAQIAREIPWKVPEMCGEIIQEFRTVIQAVAYLHDKQLVHRDIKPSNILITDGGELRLSDFGLIKSIEPSQQSMDHGPMTSTGAMVGTPTYMAPEQERGDEIEQSADVYSLGILLAEIAVGRRPKPDTRVSQKSTLQKWGPIDTIPRDLRKLVMDCTDISPAARPQNARQLSEHFETLAESQ